MRDRELRMRLIATLTASLTHDFVGLSDEDKQAVSYGFEQSHGWVEVYDQLYEVAQKIVDGIVHRFRVYDRYFDQTQGVWAYDAAAAYFGTLILNKPENEAIAAAIHQPITKV